MADRAQSAQRGGGGVGARALGEAPTRRLGEQREQQDLGRAEERWEAEQPSPVGREGLGGDVERRGECLDKEDGVVE